MFPFTSTKNSERKIQFAGVLAAAIDRFTRKFVYFNTPHITPRMCKKVHRCNLSTYWETQGFLLRKRSEFAKNLDRHTPNRTINFLSDLSLRIAIIRFSWIFFKESDNYTFIKFSFSKETRSECINSQSGKFQLFEGSILFLFKVLHRCLIYSILPKTR